MTIMYLCQIGRLNKCVFFVDSYMSSKFCRLMRYGDILSSYQVPIMVSGMFAIATVFDAIHICIQLAIFNYLSDVSAVCCEIWRGSLIVSFISLAFTCVSTYHILLRLANLFKTFNCFEFFYQLTLATRILSHLGKLVATTVLIMEIGEEKFYGKFHTGSFVKLMLHLGIRDIFEILNQCLYTNFSTNVSMRRCLLLSNQLQLVASITLNFVAVIVTNPNLLQAYQFSFMDMMLHTVLLAAATALLLNLLMYIFKVLMEYFRPVRLVSFNDTAVMY